MAYIIKKEGGDYCYPIHKTMDDAKREATTRAMNQAEETPAFTIFKLTPVVLVSSHVEITFTEAGDKEGLETKAS